MCKLHGVRLIKGIQTFLKYVLQFLTKQSGLRSQHKRNRCRIIIQFVFMCDCKILRYLCVAVRYNGTKTRSGKKLKLKYFTCFF